MPPGKLPLDLIGNLGYQPYLHEDKQKKWIHCIKDTGGLRATLQEEYQLATTTAQHSRNLAKLCCHRKVSEAARRGPIEYITEDSMAGTKWSILRAFCVRPDSATKCGEEVEEGTIRWFRLEIAWYFSSGRWRENCPYMYKFQVYVGSFYWRGDREHLLRMWVWWWTLRGLKQKSQAWVGEDGDSHQRGWVRQPGRQRLSHSFSEQLCDDVWT